jgi:hypothetical protein
MPVCLNPYNYSIYMRIEAIHDFGCPAHGTPPNRALLCTVAGCMPCIRILYVRASFGASNCLISLPRVPSSAFWKALWTALQWSTHGSLALVHVEREYAPRQVTKLAFLGLKHSV